MWMTDDLDSSEDVSPSPQCSSFPDLDKVTVTSCSLSDSAPSGWGESMLRPEPGEHSDIAFGSFTPPSLPSLGLVLRTLVELFWKKEKPFLSFRPGFPAARHEGGDLLLRPASVCMWPLIFSAVSVVTGVRFVKGSVLGRGRRWRRTRGGLGEETEGLVGLSGGGQESGTGGGSGDCTKTNPIRLKSRLAGRRGGYLDPGRKL